MLKSFLKNCAVILLSLFLISNCWAGIDFDGVDDYVDLINLAETSSGSFSMWIKPSVNIDSNSQIGLFNNGTVDIESIIVRWYGALGALDFYITDGDWVTAQTTTTSWTGGVWYYIVGTWNGTNIKIYINGQLQDSELQGSPVTKTGNWHIGLAGLSTTPLYFPGLIDEVTIWNVALTQTEIDLLYNSKIKGMPLQIRPANLVLYCPIDDQETGTSADGDIVRDLSGNGNNGTGVDGANNTGLAWVGESVLSYPPKIGNWE